MENSEMRKFSIIDHTADIGVAAYGTTREELFANAALGMFNIIGNTRNVTAQETREICVRAGDVELLLAVFLSELLYLFEMQHFMVHDVSVASLSDTEVRAAARGEPISPKHEIYTEIKAVTRHELKVEKTTKGWSATVLFDI